LKKFVRKLWAGFSGSLVKIEGHKIAATMRQAALRLWLTDFPEK
jgi:hypothetical protein